MKHNAEDYKTYVGKKAGILIAGIILCVVLFLITISVGAITIPLPDVIATIFKGPGELGGSTTPQITGAHHAECHLLDKFSIESLFCPGREFLHFVLMYIAFASIGSGETDELALLVQNEM